MSGKNLFGNADFKFPGMDKLVERMFRKVPNVAWDLMTGKTGVRTEDGIFSVDGVGDEATIVGNLFDGMSMALPAFAQATSAADVKIGDLILRNSTKPSWVIGRTEPKIVHDKDADGKDIDGTGKAVGQVSFKLLSVDGTISSWKVPKIQMMGFDAGGVMVVRTLMSMLPGGQSDLTSMQGMMMPMLMSGMLGNDGGEDALGEMLPMMLMMGQQSGGLANSPFAANGGNFMMQLMQMKMMSKLFGNQGGGRNNGYSRSGGISPFGTD